MEEIQPLYQELQAVVNNSNIDLQRALQLTKQLRLKMLKIPFLTPDGVYTKDEIKVVLRDILEISARLEILAEDTNGFLRTMENLKICYHQY